MENYFILGFHCVADCCYITHNYFHIPNEVIHDNANLILFNQDSKNLLAIQGTFVNGDMPFGEFRTFFSECAAQPYMDSRSSTYRPMCSTENIAPGSITPINQCQYLKTRCSLHICTMWTKVSLKQERDVLTWDYLAHRNRLRQHSLHGREAWRG